MDITKKSRCSATTLSSGGKGNRTPDLLNAIQTLYQLSYTPKTITERIIRIEAILVKYLCFLVMPSSHVPFVGFIVGPCPGKIEAVICLANSKEP